MALSIFSSLPSTFDKTFIPKNGSLSLPISNSNIRHPTQCMATYEISNDQTQTVSRPYFKFQPSIWTNDYIQSLSSEDMYAEKCKVLREEVRMMICKMENEVDQLEFIDVLQRLGVDYHFNNEIRKLLDNIYNTQTSMLKNNLHVTALKFRLLRQHGYDVSTDVFVCFQDLKKDQVIDVEGMLSMYEASFHSFEDETILDEARDFTTKFLKEYLNKIGDNDVMALQISNALELPIHWRIHRWKAQWFIGVYEKKKNMSPVLLEFAKLDYNILQSIYQEELQFSSRWWERTVLGGKLNFARDRIVENYIWTVGTIFSPNSGYFRKVLTKIGALITLIDDVYDVYGTLEDLEHFTEAIDRWDLNGLDSLPEYMKMCFEPLYTFVNEVGSEIQNKSGCDITPHLKKAWTGQCKTYMTEARWYHSGYTPSLEEYLENAWISVGISNILIHGYFLTQHGFKIEDMARLEQDSNIIRFSEMVVRLANDLGTYKRENDTGDIPKTVQCYMNKTGASEADACEYVNSMILTVWKKMNKEAHTSSFSRGYIDSAINIARMAMCMYVHGDGHSIQDPEIQNRIMSLVFQPVPIISTQHVGSENDHVANIQGQLDGDTRI